MALRQVPKLIAVDCAAGVEFDGDVEVFMEFGLVDRFTSLLPWRSHLVVVLPVLEDDGVTGSVKKLR